MSPPLNSTRLCPLRPGPPSPPLLLPRQAGGSATAACNLLHLLPYPPTKMTCTLRPTTAQNSQINPTLRNVCVGATMMRMPGRPRNILAPPTPTSPPQALLPPPTTSPSPPSPPHPHPPPKMGRKMLRRAPTPPLEEEPTPLLLLLLRREPRGSLYLPTRSALGARSAIWPLWSHTCTTARLAR